MNCQSQAYKSNWHGKKRHAMTHRYPKLAVWFNVLFQILCLHSDFESLKMYMLSGMYIQLIPFVWTTCCLGCHFQFVKMHVFSGMYIHRILVRSPSRCTFIFILGNSYLIHEIRFKILWISYLYDTQYNINVNLKENMVPRSC